MPYPLNHPGPVERTSNELRKAIRLCPLFDPLQDALQSLQEATTPPLPSSQLQNPESWKKTLTTLTNFAKEVTSTIASTNVLTRATALIELNIKARKLYQTLEARGFLTAFHPPLAHAHFIKSVSSRLVTGMREQLAISASLHSVLSSNVALHTFLRNLVDSPLSSKDILEALSRAEADLPLASHSPEPGQKFFPADSTQYRSLLTAARQVETSIVSEMSRSENGKNNDANFAVPREIIWRLFHNMSHPSTLHLSQGLSLENLSLNMAPCSLSLNALHPVIRENKIVCQTKVALKVIPVHTDMLRNSDIRLSFERETFRLRTLLHPCILTFFGSYWPIPEAPPTENPHTARTRCHPAYTVVERMTCDLRQARNHNVLKSARTRLSILNDVASAVRYLHGLRLRHGAITPENVLLRLDDDAMYGHAKLDITRFVTDVTKKVASPQAAESAFAPPEVFAGKDEGCFTADVWSFGVLIAFVFHDGKDDLFENSIAMRRAVSKELLYVFVKNLVSSVRHSEIKELVFRCLEFNPAERLSFRQVADSIEGMLREITEPQGGVLVTDKGMNSASDDEVIDSGAAEDDHPPTPLEGIPQKLSMLRSRSRLDDSFDVPLPRVPRRRPTSSNLSVESCHTNGAARELSKVGHGGGRADVNKTAPSKPAALDAPNAEPKSGHCSRDRIEVSNREDGPGRLHSSSAENFVPSHCPMQREPKSGNTLSNTRPSPVQHDIPDITQSLMPNATDYRGPTESQIPTERPVPTTEWPKSPIPSVTQFASPGVPALISHIPTPPVQQAVPSGPERTQAAHAAHAAHAGQGTQAAQVSQILQTAHATPTAQTAHATSRAQTTPTTSTAQTAQTDRAAQVTPVRPSRPLESQVQSAVYRPVASLSAQPNTSGSASYKTPLVRSCPVPSHLLGQGRPQGPQIAVRDIDTERRTMSPVAPSPFQPTARSRTLKRPPPMASRPSELNAFRSPASNISNEQPSESQNQATPQIAKPVSDASSLGNPEPIPCTSSAQLEPSVSRPFSSNLRTEPVAPTSGSQSIAPGEPPSFARAPSAATPVVISDSDEDINLAFLDERPPLSSRTRNEPFREPPHIRPYTARGAWDFDQADEIEEVEVQKELCDLKAAEEFNKRGKQYLFGGNNILPDVGKAFDFFKRAADAGSAEGAFNVAGCYYEGRGTDQDKDQADEYYQIASRRGHEDAQMKMAERFAATDTMQDKKTAFSLYEKAAKQSNRLAIFKVGHFLENGIGTDPNIDGALTMYKKAAGLNCAEAELCLGKMYESGRVVSVDHSLAIGYYVKAAQHDCMESHLKLGNCYRDGHMVEKNDERAASHYLAAAGKGTSAEAMFQAAMCCETGKGVKLDLRKAMALYEKAANNGMAKAMYHLGEMNASGIGGDVNRARAIFWWKGAMEEGMHEAMMELGRCAEKGFGMRKSPHDALRYYKKAMDTGNVEAFAYAGLLYERGEIGDRGGKKLRRIDTAAKLYEKGALKGDPKAKGLLGECLLTGIGKRSDVTLAIEMFKSGTRKGDALSFFHLGDCYREGIGVERNEEEAVHHYFKAAEKGHAEAQVRYAECLLNGTGTAKDETKANFFAERAIAQKWGGGFRFKGDCHAEGYGIPVDKKKAADYYRKGVEVGDSDCMVRLGGFYERGHGVPVDKRRAWNLYVKASKLGCALAESNVGVMYEKGEGVKQSFEKAVHHYKLAMDKGSAEATGNLGDCYMKGNGVPKSVQKAIELYEDAARNGDVGAKCEMGTCYYDGIGVSKDYERAVRFFREAADDGEPEALRRLAMANMDGCGVEHPDYEKAVEYLKEAMESGNCEAIVDLGRCYRMGTGVPKNDKMAADLFEKAVEKGNVMATKYLGNMCFAGEGVAVDARKSVKFFSQAHQQLISAFEREN